MPAVLVRMVEHALTTVMTTTASVLQTYLLPLLETVQVGLHYGAMFGEQHTDRGHDTDSTCIALQVDRVTTILVTTEAIAPI